jgi:hypothetical protein
MELAAYVTLNIREQSPLQDIGLLVYIVGHVPITRTPRSLSRLPASRRLLMWCLERHVYRTVRNGYDASVAWFVLFANDVANIGLMLLLLQVCRACTGELAWSTKSQQDHEFMNAGGNNKRALPRRVIRHHFESRSKPHADVIIQILIHLQVASSLRKMRLSLSSILTTITVLAILYMIPSIVQTAVRRLPTQITRRTALVGTTSPLAAFSLFNLGSSFSSMGGRNDIHDQEAPLPPKINKEDSEWRAQLSPEQVSLVSSGD